MPSYFTINPSSETGTKNITITAQPNTGRNSRSETFKAYSTNVASLESSNYLIVHQAEKPGFLEEVVPKPSPTATDTSATYNFKSNLANIKVVVPSNPAATVSSATICGVQLTSAQIAQLTGSSGYNVVDSSSALDPGQYAEYNIAITFAFDQNQGQTDKTYSFTVNGTTYQFTQGHTEVTRTLAFSSSVTSDRTAEGIEVTLNASGAYADGADRILQVTTTPATGVSWTIDAVSNDNSTLR